MNTIEEKAKEYANEVNGELGEELYHDSEYTRNEITETDFLAGYNTALEITKDSEKELIDLRCELKIANEKCSSLESYSGDLELKAAELENNTTELIMVNEGSFYEVIETKCCGIGVITTENYCPNCGRKIIRN